MLVLGLRWLRKRLGGVQSFCGDRRGDFISEVEIMGDGECWDVLMPFFSSFTHSSILLRAYLEPGLLENPSFQIPQFSLLWDQWGRETYRATHIQC